MTSSSIWQPTADISTLQTRAKILKEIRQFFADRDVLEVETPLISKFGVTDPHINAIPVLLDDKERYYLQTSPEYGMKRLLAAGSGAIYQLTKAFREGDIGNAHNPEFTMLEWYRPGFDHFQLMTEVDNLLQTILHTKSAQRVTYKELFQQYLSFDPHIVTMEQLKKIIYIGDFNFSDVFIKEATIDDWLQVLFSYYIEPKLIGDTPWIVYNYPASQAALAKLKQESNIIIAERFEVYVQGIELANGYHELTEPKQQLIRFQRDQKTREQLKKPFMAIDDRLIAALDEGLPACAGIALGVDRLVMLAVNASSIQEVIAFPLARA
jgi:lysyl-tRNA synthetase class 2